MAGRSDIEWCDASWNPIAGCSVVSPGCTHCYAMRMAARIERMAAGRSSLYGGLTQPGKAGAVWTGEVRAAGEETLTAPLRWRAPRAIFVNSMGDLFHESVPDAWIDRVFAVIALAPQHTFIVLTKRAKRMREYFVGPWINQAGVAARVAEATLEFAPSRHKLPNPPTVIELPVGPRLASGEPEFGFRRMISARAWPLPNVVLGVSAEDQQRADERIPDLLATPAAKRIVSAEPLLGPIDFQKLAPGQELSGRVDPEHVIAALTGGIWDRLMRVWDRPCPRLDGVIVGGESGPNARPMAPDWARRIKDDCAAAGVPFFFKQWGGWAEIQQIGFSGWQRTADRDGKMFGRVSQGGSFRSDAPEFETLFIRRGPDHPGAILVRTGKRVAGRRLDGREHNDLPWSLAK